MTKDEKKEMRKMIAESIDDVVIPATDRLIKDSENRTKKEIEFQMDHKLFKLKNDMNDKSKEYKDEILNKEDALMKEIKDFREEQVFNSYNLEKQNEKDLDHEKRIVALEEKMA